MVIRRTTKKQSNHSHVSVFITYALITADLFSFVRVIVVIFAFK